MTDALVYPLSFALNLQGRPPTSCHAHIVRDAGAEVDSRGHLQLSWRGECTAHLTYGFGMEYRNTYTVWGESGYLTADRVFSRPPDLEDGLEIVSADIRERIPVSSADQFLLMLVAFAAKIRGTDRSGLNESRNLLQRMKIIGRLRDAYFENGATDVEL